MPPDDFAPLPARLPVDILHLSDLHWGARASGQESAQDRWNSFLGHLTDCRQQGLFQPDFIAFTGDLVDSPWPRSEPHFRRGVNALLEVAGRCGFVTGNPHWAADQAAPPAAWWDLLGRRLWIVPGNHDFYFTGLRALWQRWTRPWAALSIPPGEAAAPAAVLSGPLAVLLLDSNGGRRLWSYARGEVERQSSLRWPQEPSPHHFRMALMHGHPLQVPFLLSDLDSEQLMLINNSGLLLKNLAKLGVRLLLHGHRHFPSISTLSLPAGDEAMQPIVVVGAGSVTRPPAQWPYHAYDWIRIHPDHRVEVTLGKRLEGESTFALGAPRLADAGDFRYDLVRKEVAIHERTGDLDIRLTISGFRVLPGRPAVSRIPFAITRELFASLAAWSFGFPHGRNAASTVRWEDTSASLLVEPPQRWDSAPLDLELRYFIHNGEALSRWEAAELYGDDVRAVAQGGTSLTVTCETRAIEIQGAFPGAFHDTTANQFTGRVVRAREVLEPEASSALGNAIEWDRKQRRVSVRHERPQSNCRYEISWLHPEDPPTLREVARRLLLIRLWQRWLLDEHGRGSRPLDGECRVIAASLTTLGLPAGTHVSLFVPDTNELHRPPFGSQEPLRQGALRLVGATMTLSGPPARWSLPYGAGVAGRAWRAGTTQLYHVTDAATSREAYERGDLISPANFYIPFSNGPQYLALLAAPILPSGLAAELSVEVSSGRFALLVVSIGSTSPGSPLLEWGAPEVGRLVEHVLSPLERRAYEMAQRHARDREPAS